MALWPIEGSQAWMAAPLDRLIDALEKHAPSCRVVALDAHVSWPTKLQWPELAGHAAIVGPADQVEVNER